MRIFDAHIHADVRSYEDFHNMALFGTKGVLICAHNSVNFSNAGSLTDHFDSLLERQCQRLAANGITPLVALGIHPRGIPKTELDASLRILPDYLRHPKTAALGEIGLDLGGEKEEFVLYQQLLIAKQLAKPCLIHTPPHPQKKERLLRICSLLDEAQLPPNLVLIDHLNREVLPKVKEKGYYLGLSAHPAKLGPVEIAELIRDFGTERIIVSSDLGNSKADVGALPTVIAELKHRQLPVELIEKVVYQNALDFLNVSLSE